MSLFQFTPKLKKLHSNLLHWAAYGAVIRLTVFVKGCLAARWVPWKPSQSRALLVIDFSYKSTRGHHHALNQLLVRSARDANLKISILSSRYLSLDLRADHIRPTFRAEVYEDCQTERAWRERARRVFVVTCEDLITQSWQAFANPNVAVLVHTTTVWHLSALLGALRACRARCLVNVYLMLPPENDAPAAMVPEQEKMYFEAWQYAMSPSHTLRVRFFTENLALQERYRSIGLESIKFRPLPAYQPGAPASGAAELRTRGVATLLFLGDPRPGKGFRLLSEALDQIERQALPVKVRLRLTSLSEAQRAALRRHEQLLLDLRIQDFYSEQEYFSELSAADAVLLPYDPEEYRTKNSNVVFEAIASGTPVIISPGDNSLMRFARDLPVTCHVEMPDYSASGLVAGIRRFLDARVELQHAAGRVGPAVMATRDPKAFLTELFA